MINIKDKKDCCGCSACAQRCPKQCITMHNDKEGFLYPIIDTSLCIDCGLCEKVCPILNKNEPQKPLKVYAAYNKNEDVRLKSSSGGIFTQLAEAILNEKGVVFGVKFDKDWMPVFDYAETIADIEFFRGSKYAQATVGNAYKEAEGFLKTGRKVLFSGTPCQIAGLKKYLRKDYENLLTVDIICHGVPSPKVWKIYLNETCAKLINNISSKNSNKSDNYKYNIENVCFRDKTTGWKDYSFSIKLDTQINSIKEPIIFSQKFMANDFMQAFLNNTILRPSCYNCPTKQGKSHSDITIADFWGIDKIDPEFDDDKGCGAIFINTEKGNNSLSFTQANFKEKSIEEAILYNSSYCKSCNPHVNRKRFFDGLDKATSISLHIQKMQRLPLSIRIKYKIRFILKSILHKNKKKTNS